MNHRIACPVHGLRIAMLLGAMVSLMPERAFASGVAEHVVVVVFDGLRPDFITPQYAPNLYSLATNGVFFRRNHCAFVSTTIVNGTTLATGVFPGRSGILANSDFNPELSFTTSYATEALDYVRRGDLMTKGQYLGVDTVAELIQDAGHHTFIAGTKGVTLLHDRAARREDKAHKDSVTLFRGVTLPRSTLDALNRSNDDKAFPNDFTHPNLASDKWTTKALIRGLWDRKGIPRYSLLWLSDPDVTQHQHGLGSSQSLTAIENSDKNLGEVVKYLRDRKVLDKTDIMVVSDHGFSTVARGNDVTEALRRAGLNAHAKVENPETSDVIVVSLGGAALVYVVDRPEATVRKVAEVLQQSNFTGVLFSRLQIEGTFPMSAIHYEDSRNQPDFVVSMRWLDESNENGVPGMLLATGGSRNGGAHGSLSRYEMNNSLVASGPDFQRGLVSEIPSGNIDVAPTILDILGVPTRRKMDGRVLREAYASSLGWKPSVHENRLEATRRIGFMRWKQYLKTSEVEGTLYFDEGNGESRFE